MCVDLSEVISKEFSKIEAQPAGSQQLKVAFQSPCSLQHGQKLNGEVEAILRHLGYTLLDVEDNHLCCGSAGTYSVLQPVLSRQLKDDKLKKLQKDSPDVIVTANVGCQLHLRGNAEVPLMHWIELLENPGF